MSLQGICIKDEKIKVVEEWPKPKSIRDIQVFFEFTNFYWQFIQDFSCITAPLISMLKTIGSTGFAANLKKTKNKASSNSIVDNNMVNDGEITN